MKQIVREDMNRVLILTMDESYRINYEVEMLVYNKLKTFLPLQIRTLNGHYQFAYLIENRKSLKDYLDGKKLNYGEMKRILESVLRCMEEVTEYMLSMDGIGLVMDDVFVDEKKELFFFYHPSKKVHIVEQLKLFIESLMPYVDRSEREAGFLLYGFYGLLLEQGTTLLQLKNYMRDVEQEQKKKKEKILMLAEEKNSYLNDEIYQGVGMTEPYRDLRIKDIEDKKDMKFNANQETKQDKDNDKKVTVKKKLFSFFHEEDDVMSSYVRGLYPVKRKDQAILLGAKSNLQIGSDHRMADHVMLKGDISPLHAKLFQLENQVFLADIGSEKGTIVNGKKLAPNVPQALYDGDHVTLGKTKLIYHDVS